MPRQITAQSPIQIFIQEQPHSTSGDGVLSCFLQQRDYLFPLHTRKSFEKLLDGIARLQMIEQTLYWDTRAGKTGSPPRISGSCDTTLLTSETMLSKPTQSKRISPLCPALRSRRISE